MPVELLSAAEAARRLGITARTVRRWLKSGRLNGRKIGERGHWRVEWDSSIAGGAIISPINKFVSKTCVRHGGTKVSRVDWSERGSVGKQLKITVHAMNREDCITALRRISGGMTLDEINSVGSCTVCEGYTWHDDETQSPRRVVHGKRENLNRSNEEESVKVLKDILEVLKRDNPSRRVTTPVAPTYPVVPTYPLAPSPSNPDPWAWRDGNVNWRGEVTTDDSVATSSASNTTYTLTNNTANSASGSVGVIRGVPVFMNDDIPDNDPNYIGPAASTNVHVNIATTLGIFFVPLATQGLETGTYMTPELIANKTSEDHGEEEGIFLQVVDRPLLPGTDPAEGEEAVFRVMGVNPPAPITITGTPSASELSTFRDRIVESTDDTIEIDDNDLATSRSLERTFSGIVAAASEDEEVNHDHLLRNQDHARAISEIMMARPAGISMRAYVDAIAGGFTNVESVAQTMYDAMVRDRATRELEDNEFYLPVAEQNYITREMVTSTTYYSMDIDGVIYNNGLFIRSSTTNARRRDPTAPGDIIGTVGTLHDRT